MADMDDCEEECYPQTAEGFLAMRKVPYTNWLKPNEGEINAEGESKATAR
jgi:hypothetical protein